MFAAELLLAGQAAWVALPSLHHGKNHSYCTTILQLEPPLQHTEHMQSYSFSISNLVLAVPSTEIIKWKTDFHTSKDFT